MTDWLTFWMNDRLANWLMSDWRTDWLIDWPTGWLTDGLTDILSGWPFDWLTDLLGCGLTERLDVWQTDWLADWPTGWMTDWVMADWLTDLQTDRLTDLLTCWMTDCDRLACWVTEGLKGWMTDDLSVTVMGRLVDCCWPGLLVGWLSSHCFLLIDDEMVDELITSTDLPITTEWLMKTSTGQLKKNP